MGPGLIARRTLFLALLAAGCRSGGAATRPADGGIAVEWSGTARGALAAPAQALWCARDTLLEITAVRNDTAVGLALIPRDSLATGSYSVFSARVFTPFRPQANVALRWLAQTDLKGYESASGSVVVTEAGPAGVSGRIEAVLRLPTGGDSIRLTGGFSRLAVGKALDACGRANRPGAG